MPGHGSVRESAGRRRCRPSVHTALRSTSRLLEGSATAIAEPGRDHARLTTFTALTARIDALAGTLRGAGVQPGHRVALLVPPGLELTAAVYACWRAGAAIVVADTGLGWRRMAEALRSADPDHLVGVPAAIAAAAALRIPGGRIVVGDRPRPVRRLRDASMTRSAGEKDRARLTVVFPPGTRTISSGTRSASTANDEAAVLFTSGATGPPKGVVYRHSQLHAQLELVRTLCSITPDDRLVAAFAPFALYGPALGVGAAVPRMDVTRPGTLTAEALADAAASVGATLVFASPAALRNVVATAGRLTPDQQRSTRAHPAGALGRCAGGSAAAAPPTASPPGGGAAHPVRDDRGPARNRHCACLNWRRWARAMGSASAAHCLAFASGSAHSTPSVGLTARRCLPSRSPGRSVYRLRTSRTGTTGCGRLSRPAPVTRGGTALAMSATSMPPGGCGSRAGWLM